MSQVQHTSAPWVFGKTSEDRRLILGGPSRRYVATVTIHQIPRHMGLWEEGEREANARLIAASPTMFDYVQSRADAGCPEATKILEAINARS